MIILSERTQVPFLEHVLFGCFNVDALSDCKSLRYDR